MKSKKWQTILKIISVIFILVLGTWIQNFLEIVIANPHKRNIILIVILSLLGLGGGIVWLIYLRLFKERYEQIKKEEELCRAAQEVLETHLLESTFEMLTHPLPIEKWLTDTEAKEKERNAWNCIWLHARSLEPDTGKFLPDIIDNIRAGKNYRYIFPEKMARDYKKLVQQCRTGAANAIAEGRLQGHGSKQEGADVQLVILDADYEEGTYMEAFLHYPKLQREKRTVPIEDKKRAIELANSFKTFWNELHEE